MTTQTKTKDADVDDDANDKAVDQKGKTGKPMTSREKAQADEREKIAARDAARAKDPTERSAAEAAALAEEPQTSLPDRWEVGQTEEEAAANAVAQNKHADVERQERERIAAAQEPDYRAEPGNQYQTEAGEPGSAEDEAARRRGTGAGDYTKRAGETEEQARTRRKAEKDEAHRKELEADEATPASQRRR